jgi:hypothetical protein
MFCCMAEAQGMCAEPFSDYDKARQWLLAQEVAGGVRSSAGKNQ